MSNTSITEHDWVILLAAANILLSFLSGWLHYQKFRYAGALEQLTNATKTIVNQIPIGSPINADQANLITSHDFASKLLGKPELT